MTQQLPLIVWVVWLSDHIYTSEDGSLAIFAKRKDADAWNRKNATGQYRVRRMTMTSWK